MVDINLHDFNENDLFVYFISFLNSIMIKQQKGMRHYAIFHLGWIPGVVKMY